MRSPERKEPERSSVAPALGQALAVLVGERRQQRQRRAGEGNRVQVARFARLDHAQVHEFLQPFVDQLVGEPAQPPADHLDMAPHLDHGKEPPVVGRKIHLEGEIRLADVRRRQGFLACGGERIN